MPVPVVHTDAEAELCLVRKALTTKAILTATSKTKKSPRKDDMLNVAVGAVRDFPLGVTDPLWLLEGGS